MLTRVFWLLEEQTRYSLKPLLKQYLFQTPSAFAGLDYRLRRVASILRARTIGGISDHLRSQRKSVNAVAFQSQFPPQDPAADSTIKPGRCKLRTQQDKL